MSWYRRLWPEERIALLFFAGVATLFASRLYPFTLWPLLRAYLNFLLAISLFVLPPWIVVTLVRRRRGRTGPGAPAKELATYLRALLALLAVLVPYTNLKCRLLLFHPQLFDPVFAHLDDLLHMGGGDFPAWVARFHSPAWTGPMHFIYYNAWGALALPLAVAMARSGAALVRRTLAALTLCYVAGVFVYLAFPSLGPALVDRARYAAVAQSYSFILQREMLDALRYIVENPQAPAVPFFGLAAFPSLHLATSALGLLLAWRTWRPLLVLLVPWNLAIVASAIYFGWHYAVDFYPALLLSWGAWAAAGRLTAAPRDPGGAGGAETSPAHGDTPRGQDARQADEFA